MKCFTGPTNNGTKGLVAARTKALAAKAVGETLRDFRKFWMAVDPVAVAVDNPEVLYERRHWSDTEWTARDQ